MFRKIHKGLIRKCEGPLPILKKVGNVAYKLQLPANLRIRPVFHVSCLKLYHEDKEDLIRGISHRAQATMTTSFNKDVEVVLDSWIVVDEEYHFMKSTLSNEGDFHMETLVGSAPTPGGNSRRRSMSFSGHEWRGRRCNRWGRLSWSRIL